MIRLLLLYLALLVMVPVRAQETPLPADPFTPGADTAAITAAAPYSARFDELALNRPLTALLYDLSANRLLAGLDIDKQMPVVSAVKGPVLLYFLHRVDPAVWGGVPVEYWNAAPDDVPEAYQADWEAHRAILRDLHRMIVYSDNVSTGNAIAYAYEARPMDDANPVEAFNRWSAQVIGISDESGMREWDEGATNNPRWIDARFNQRLTTIYGVRRFYNNTYSALDLARFYHWLYNDADPAIFETAQALMSIVAGFPGFLEDTAWRLDGTPVSKDGFVGPGDRGNADDEYLTADAGLILLDDRALIVITMGVNGGDRLDEIYNEIQRVVRLGRAELYWPPGADYVTWMRGAEGPFGENTLSTEALYFIMDYLTGAGLRPVPGQVLDDRRALFEEARAVWLAVFPGDVVPAARTPEQARVMAARYGGSGERLIDIARELNLIPIQTNGAASDA
ncbi:MAG: hypothetical protein ACOCXZ_01580 [Chloroflexota bacterium]